MLSKAKSRHTAGPSKIKIYTRTGDKGQTFLYAGKRVSKSDPRVVACGTIDELNSLLGFLLSYLPQQGKIPDFLNLVSADLFNLGAGLSGMEIDPAFLKSRISQMERLIDNLDSSLPELKNFVLPGGTKKAALAHFVRTVCRRAEREVVRLKEVSESVNPNMIVYLNRLSDLFFVIARYLNIEAGEKESIWKKSS